MAYFVFAAVMIGIQLLTLVEAVRHIIYTRRKYRPQPSKYHPKTALITPCKGHDTTFERNIRALFRMDYPAYEIFFVVESETDPAHGRLVEIIREMKEAGSRSKAHLLVAGLAQTSSQKLHNQLFVYRRIPRDFEVLSFIDSDACPKPHFLASLVHPLRRAEVGAATGYRWFVPEDKSLSSKVLSAMNAVFASMLGPHNWNTTWGGAMAMKRELFERLGVEALWKNSITDDYTLTYAVQQAELEVIFVPACFVASYEHMDWRTLFSFARRQFLITRVYKPRLWWLALASYGSAMAVFWGGLIVSVALLAQNSPWAKWAAILPGFLYLSWMFKAVARQLFIFKILREDRGRLRAPARLDIFLQPVVSLFTLATLVASGLTRTILWRGYRYVLHGMGRTEIIREGTAAAGTVRR